MLLFTSSIVNVISAVIGEIADVERLNSSTTRPVYGYKVTFVDPPVVNERIDGVKGTVSAGIGSPYIVK